MNKLLASTALATALLWGVSAHAVPISSGSEISITGPDTYIATAITFTGAGDVVGTGGDFTSVLNCANCVTMIGSLVAGATGNLYTVTSGATTSLALNADEVFKFDNSNPLLPSLTVTGSGTLHLTGFDPTPGQYEITTQGPTGGVHVSFSATSIATPEPASLAILGSGLLALGWACRRRQRS